MFHTHKKCGARPVQTYIHAQRNLQYLEVSKHRFHLRRSRPSKATERGFVCMRCRGPQKSRGVLEGVDNTYQPLPSTQCISLHHYTRWSVAYPPPTRDDRIYLQKRIVVWSERLWSWILFSGRPWRGAQITRLAVV